MNTIKVSDKHLKLIQAALELYTRCSIGQFEHIMELPSVQKEVWREDNNKALDTEHYLRLAHTAYTGSAHGGPGIYNKEQVTDDARDAMNIHDQIRHHLWKKKGEERTGGFVYEYDALEKLIEIK